MSRSAPRPLSIVVTGAGVLLTLALTWAVLTLNAHNNDRLLTQQVRQAASALAADIPVIQSELDDAASVAAATLAEPTTFEHFVSSRVTSTGTFASISLWRVTDGHATLVATQGVTPRLVSDNLASSFFDGVHPSSQLFVTAMLSGAQPRLGFADMPEGETSDLVVYAESPLPANRQVTMPKSSPFGDLKFALYLGAKQIDSQLLEASAPVPIGGHTASVSLPFADSSITLVGASDAHLAGGISTALPWIVLGVGCLLALASGSTVEYVTRRRLVAEGLARDNERLYMQQRDIASTLQHALLPNVPTVDGIDVAARYAAGVTGMDVGGDWYDVICTQPGRVVFVVGDVSGRGLRAATTMASLRHSIRAYVTQGDDISTVLVKLGSVLSFDDDHQFATILIGELDVAAHRVTIASAGHFLPLLVTENGAEFVRAQVVPPVGITELPPTTTSFDVPKRATLIGFTDGLVERKGEIIDTGLDRLRGAAFDPDRSLEEILDVLMSTLVPEGAEDDTVIVGLRWQN